MSIFKKIISMFLAFLMIFGAAAGIGNLNIADIGIKAEAATVYTEGYYSYTVENGNATITAVDESISGDVTVPSTLGGYPVTCIGDGAFYARTNITSVIIPDGITSIGGSSFYCCFSLKKINFPDSITSIGNGAFADCHNLENITIPAGVTSIGGDAFLDCKSFTSITVVSENTVYSNDEYGVLFNKDKTELIYYPIGNNRTDYKIPDSVISIGGDAFRECKTLKNIYIHAGVSSIGLNTFRSCKSRIIVDYENQNYSSDDYGVLFNKDKTTLLYYPDGEGRIHYKIPGGVTWIGYCAFEFCTNLTSITIDDSVIGIGGRAFFACDNLEDVYYTGNESEWNKIYIDGHNESLSEATLHFYQEIEPTNATVTWVVGDKSTVETYEVGAKITPPADPIKDGYTFKGWSPSVPSVMPAEDLTFTAVFEKIPEVDIYNLGDETYSFKNFTDSDSNGHCFGMSMTSSGYHTGELDIATIGGSEQKNLYSLDKTSKVKTPICYYQKIQKEYSRNAIVAGGANYKNSQKWDIASDWNEVVNYVKNHAHDGKGDLQIGFRKRSVDGGHAVNFLRYEEVAGQARIYAYDNNFPDTETYFYMNSKGNVLQYPKSTFSGAIDCIALRSVSKYFDLVVDFDATRYIYAKRDSIAIEGIEAYLMDGSTETGCTVMFEVPSDAKQITIVPLVDNAEFEYLDGNYSFGGVNDDTVGVFRLVSADDAASGENKADFTIVNGGSAVAPEVTAEIRKPSVTTINYGDSIVLHADVTNLPSDAYIEWTASNGSFTYSASADGTTCTVSPASSGDTTFTATVYDANGNVIDSDEQVMTAKAGFFQKIIAFFKKLFGMTKVIPQFFEE